MKISYQKILLSILIVVITFPSIAIAQQRPKLVVGIVVDQMRWDYLYRFYDRYSNDGFKRLMNEGFNCQQTSVNYLPSYTAPGHTCIYTGSVPALHGIVANDWIDNTTGKEVYCTQDDSVRSVGGGKAGLMSPKNLLATTITDELRLATNFRSKVIGISLKDRGAILPAGHSANAAYWFDSKNGHFITSSFYRNDLPQWLVNFNNRNIADSLMNLNWNTLYPINTYTQSTADDNAYEGKFKGEDKPVFPHPTSKAVLRKDYGEIKATPYGNTITEMLAEATIEGEQLGQGKFTDFLTVSFSSTDYIGHKFAPNAIETEDTYLRLDKNIADLLHYLDNTIGKGNYLLFLTADHGGAHNPTFLNDHGIHGKSVSFKELKNQLNHYLFTQFNDSSLVNSLMNYQVSFNENTILEKKINRDEVRAKTIDWLKSQQGVAFVLDLEHPEKNICPQEIYQRVANGYNSKRCGAIQIIMEPGWFSGYAPTGTTHGSWNPYDTHIPLLWYGWQIPKGTTYETISMTDISATLAALLHIQMPSACIGKPIPELLKKVSK